MRIRVAAATVDVLDRAGCAGDRIMHPQLYACGSVIRREVQLAVQDSEILRIRAAAATVYVLDDGLTTLVLRVINEGSGTVLYYDQLRIEANNVAPVNLGSGGPYEIVEGAGVALSGSAQDVSGDSSLVFRWDIDLDQDGLFTGNDLGVANSADVTWAWSDLVTLGIVDGPSSFNVRMRVIDDGYYATIDDQPSIFTTLTVKNVLPTVQIFEVTTARLEKAPMTFRADVSGDGVDAARHSYQWRVLKDGTEYVPSVQPAPDPTVFTFTPDDNAQYEVEVTVFDGANSVVKSSVYDVANVPPSMGSLSVTPIDEGETASLTGTISDASLLDSFTLEVTWGDTAVETFAFSAGTTDFALTHQYDDDPAGTPDEYTIGLKLTDDDINDVDAPESATGSVVVAVSNLAPRYVDAGGPYVVDEGSAGTLTLFASATDPADNANLRFDWDLNSDGTYEYTNLASADLNLSWSDLKAKLGIAGGPATFQVSVRVDDQDGGVTVSDPATLVINNVAPAVAINALSTTPAEGTLVSLSATVVDPADASPAYDWSVRKDGVPFDSGTPVDQTTFDFTPDDNGLYQVSLTVSDGTDQTTAERTILVVNAVPVVASLAGGTLVDLGTPVTYNGSFSDPGSDSWSGTISVNDGSDTATLPLIFDGKTFSTDYVFSREGIYDLTVRVRDDDGGTSFSDAIAVTVFGPAALTVADVSQDEDAGVMTFTVTLSNAVPGGLTVDYSTSDDTATTGDNDFAASGGTLTFAGTAGETQTFTVAVTPDTKVETDEVFNVTLSNVHPTVGGTGQIIDASDTATGTIVNDDTATTAYDDIVGRADSTGDWWVAKSDGSSFTSEKWGKWGSTAGWVDVQIGDFNGDGRDDVVGRSASGDWWVAKSNGSGFVNERWGRWSAGATWINVHVGDFNNDGNDDLVGRVKSTGDWWVAKSTGSGFVNEKWSRWSSAVNWINVQVGDFNNDGNDDLVGRVESNGDWWVAKSTGSGFASEKWGRWSSDVEWINVQVGDFNNDGNDDLVGRVDSSGDWWVAKSNGSGFANEKWSRWSAGVTWINVQVGDFNSDGSDDLVGRVESSGDWWVAKSTGSGFVNEKWGRWSSAADWINVQVGDFTGDGNDDVAGRVKSTGDWWVAKSTDSGFVSEKWGTWPSAVNWLDVQVGNFDGATPAPAAPSGSDSLGAAAAADQFWSEVGDDDEEDSLLLDSVYVDLLKMEE